jgi:hypothetical protein
MAKEFDGTQSPASDLLSKSETGPDDKRKIRAAKKFKSLRTPSGRPAKESWANELVAAF